MELVLTIVVVLLPSDVKAQKQQTEHTDFCASRTTEAYHSPKCNWGWVVHDPHRAADVKIPHDPSYHTYSRWMLGDRAYVFAYRDIDQLPEDMAADIYLARDTQYKLVGSIQHLGEIVAGVSEARLTGAVLPDVVFREDCGELQCVVVVRFSDETAKEVFWYGASQMEIAIQPKAMIVAKSRVANVVEEFAWDPQAEKFRKIEQHPWRKAQ